MRIEHIAIWTNDLEKMRSFYIKFFNMVSSENYFNPNKNFSSYFLSFNNGARIELMHKPEITESKEKADLNLGLSHFAISVGSKQRVNELTEFIREQGYRVIAEPRKTGDGYYESVVSDPEGNRIEITE